MKQIILAGMMLLFIGLISASTLPHAFYGTVAYSDGELIQEDWIIITKINGEEVGRSDIINGRYDLVAESESSGTIYFYISGKSEIIESYTFEAFEITELNLITNIANPNQISDDSDSSSSSGRSGSSGSSFYSESPIIATGGLQTTGGTISLIEEQETTDSKITGGVIGFVKTGGGLIALIFGILIIGLGIGVIAFKKKS